MFNVLCSACFSKEWNIPNVDLFSDTCLKHVQRDTHMYLHCEVKRTEEVQTVWLLMDGLMKDKDFLCFHRLIYPVILLSHHTLRLYRFSWTHHLLICAVRGGGRWWLITNLKLSAWGSGRLLLCWCHTHWSIVLPLTSGGQAPAKNGRVEFFFFAHLSVFMFEPHQCCISQ